MKAKRSIVIWLYLMSTIVAYSQSKIGYKFGLTSGINAAQIKASILSNLFWQYNAGLVLEQRFSPLVAVAYQLSYAKQGSSSPVTGLGGDDKIINELAYINLPIMLRFSQGSKNFFLEAGGQVGYLLDGKGYFASARNQATAFHHTHKIDAGPTGGIGCRLGNHLTIDARYYYGLSPILTDYTAPDPVTGTPTFYRVVKWYNRTYSLNLSYYF